MNKIHFRLLLAFLTSFLAASSSSSAVTIATYETDWATSTTTGVASDSFALSGAFTSSSSPVGWETTDPGGSHTFVDVVSTFPQVTGDRLFHAHNDGTTATSTITLTGLAAFDTVSIDKLIVGAGGGIDHPQVDGIQVRINGTDILSNGTGPIVDLTARDRTPPGDVGVYLSNAPAAVVLQGWATNNTDGSEFISTRTDGWGHDALYDLGADPAFDNIAVSGSGTVTIDIITTLTDGNGGVETQAGDEQLVVGNFAVSFDQVVPEPSTAAMVLLGGLALLLGIRRR